MNSATDKRASTIRKIIVTKQKVIDGINADMGRLEKQLDIFNDKVASGASLTDAEKLQKDIIKGSLDTMQDNADRMELLTLEALENSAAVADLSNEVDQANQELTRVKQQIQNLTDTLTNLGTVLTGVTNLLGSLTGLLAALA